MGNGKKKEERINNKTVFTITFADLCEQALSVLDIYLTGHTQKKSIFSYFQIPTLLPSVKFIERGLRKTVIVGSVEQSEKCKGTLGFPRNILLT